MDSGTDPRSVVRAYHDAWTRGDFETAVGLLSMRPQGRGACQ